MKFAIADAIDWLWDSGVFIRKGSFNSTGNTGGIDTVVYCGQGAGVILSASGNPPYNWSVLSGNAVITGTGQNVSVTATGNSRISALGSSGQCAPDTFDIIVPVVNLDAGISDTIYGCNGSFPDTLHGIFTTTAPWLSYQFSWSPTSSIINNGNTLSPVINPTGTTKFYLLVQTDSSSGGCVWTDSVEKRVADRSVFADYTFSIRYGCDVDTVVFQNTSTSAVNYQWDFGDNTFDTVRDPIHIYGNQQPNSVILVGANMYCKDTAAKIVDTRHPLVADFTLSDDTVCANTAVTFLNTSTAVLLPTRSSWSFGDGSGDTSYSTVHQFPNSGTYQVRLIVTDVLGCKDTFFRAVVVDPLPRVSFEVSDSSICEGKRISFDADFTKEGNTLLQWYLGNNNSLIGVANPEISFDTSGKYTISLTARYRSCPDTTFAREIQVKPYPTIDLGADTFMCPNGPAIVIADHGNAINAGARWKWNTGDSTFSIAVRHPGVYTAAVDIEGCSTADSVEVFKDCYLNVPNSFSPNNDGVNDYFLPRQLLSRGLTEFKMIIYNRWGQVIFTTDRLDGAGWDGRFNGEDQPSGVYVYLIEAAFKSGMTEAYQGNVTLLR